jgi:hypothetical protein
MSKEVKNKSEWNSDKFRALLEDTGQVLQHADKLLPVAESVSRVINAAKDYQTVMLQLEVVKVKREIILREFESIDRVVDKIFNERDKMLTYGNELIERGIKKNNPASIEAGLQVIKLVLVSNPFETIIDKTRSLKDKYSIVEANLE